MTTLITGGGGYIGSRIAERLDDVILWTHSRVAPPASAARLRAIAGEITSNDPFRDVPTTIKRIIHAAAVTRFNVDPDTARAVNVEGTRKLLEFAKRCEQLESIDLLSTVYAVGLRDGVIAEEPCDGADGFANEYERSKCCAERILMSDFANLPWRIERIATVIADDDDGRVTQQNAVHNTLKLLYYGLMSLVPGKPEVPLYFVTASFVADAVCAAIEKGPLQAIYHVCHTREESITLGEFIDTVFATFEADPKFRSRRALKPIYTDSESFELMVKQVSNFSGGILGQAVGSVAPFARELFSEKEFRNDRMLSVAPHLRAPNPKQLVANVCQNLIDSRFGMAKT
ncbi:MAG TPA: SDR family oxidoreductase [Thermoanaerobaculia bacterium]